MTIAMSHSVRKVSEESMASQIETRDRRDGAMGAVFRSYLSRAAPLCFCVAIGLLAASCSAERQVAGDWECVAPDPSIKLRFGAINGKFGELFETRGGTSYAAQLWWLNSYQRRKVVIANGAIGNFAAPMGIPDGFAYDILELSSDRMVLRGWAGRFDVNYEFRRVR